MKKILLASVLVAASLLANADEVDIRKMVESKMGKVEKITKAPVAGLWEVIVDGQIVYTDSTGGYLLMGALHDLKTDRNLTAERQFSMLPLELAVKQVRGTGKNVLVTFEDPNCGYCKKLAKELVNVKNLTLYTFLYPVLGDDSLEKSKAIWCSADKAKSWNDWMINGKALGAVPAKCDIAGLEKSIELGRKLRINGTPAMFFGNGERVGGYIPAEEINKRFAGG